MSKNTDWLDTALEPLRNLPPSHTWPSAKDIGRRAALRHRRRRVGLASSGTALGLAAALLIAFVAVPRTGPQRNERTPVSLSGIRSVAGPDGSIQLLASARKLSAADPHSVSVLANSEQAFALDLTRRELSASSGSNVLVSPVSADVDLSMLELGASGQTEQQIAAALRSTSLSSGENAAAWKTLVSSELTGESPGELTLANSLWIKQLLQVEPAFLHGEAAAFGDETYQVNFALPSATNAINAWVDHATAGHISELFTPGELMPTTDVVLASALHLHAAWANPHQFTSSNGSFVTAGGQSLSVPTLTASDDRLDFAVSPSYQAVQLPYTNGRFAALIIEPTSGTMTSWLSSLTPNDLSTVVGGLSGGKVNLSMPALDLSGRVLLNTALSAMGMASAFQSADLTPMLGATLGSRVAVAQVQQADTLQVNRWGTDAAAATGTSIVPTSASAVHIIDIDHPYLFLIRDTKSGAILLSSVVNNPAAA